MNEMLKIYSKLQQVYAEVYYDPVACTIQLPCYRMTAYIAENGLPEIEMEYNCRQYRKSFENHDSLYFFLSGVMSKHITFRQIDECTIIADGLTSVTPKNIRIFRAVLNTVIGFPLAVFGVLLAVEGVFFNVDYSSPSLLFELCPLPLALAMTVVGASMLHHGFTKKPIATHGALIYGLGTAITGFALAMIMVTYGDKSEDIGIADMIGMTFLFALVLGIGIAMIVGGLLMKRDSSSNAMYRILRRIPHRLTSEEVKALVEKIKEKTITEAIDITIAPFGNMGVTDSKLGGLHYWDASMPYPENMCFIAQFNLSQLPKTKKLPHEGMLQFFSDCEENCKVVYHKKIDPNFTEETARSLGIQAYANSDIMPFEGECGFEFKLTEMLMDTSNVFSEKIIQDAARELGFKIEKDVTLDELSLDSDTTGHHLLGYPCFSQDDPREPNGKYNTLLFQLDSEMSELFSIMWGDCGVADFFINDKELENLSFDDVFFTWDCF